MKPLTRSELSALVNLCVILAVSSSNNLQIDVGINRSVNRAAFRRAFNNVSQT